MPLFYYKKATKLSLPRNKTTIVYIMSKKQKDFEKVVKILQSTTKEKPLTSDMILFKVNKTKSILNYLADSGLRAIIHQIRNRGILPVMSNHYGYYVSYDKEEIQKTYESLMSRSFAIQEAAVALKIHFL